MSMAPIAFIVVPLLATGHVARAPWTAIVMSGFLLVVSVAVILWAGWKLAQSQWDNDPPEEDGI